MHVWCRDIRSACRHSSGELKWLSLSCRVDCLCACPIRSHLARHTAERHQSANWIFVYILCVVICLCVVLALSSSMRRKRRGGGAQWPCACIVYTQTHTDCWCCWECSHRCHQHGLHFYSLSMRASVVSSSFVCIHTQCKYECGRHWIQTHAFNERELQ